MCGRLSSIHFLGPKNPYMAPVNVFKAVLASASHMATFYRFASASRKTNVIRSASARQLASFNRICRCQPNGTIFPQKFHGFCPVIASFYTCSRIMVRCNFGFQFFTKMAPKCASPPPSGHNSLCFVRHHFWRLNCCCSWGRSSCKAVLSLNDFSSVPLWVRSHFGVDMEPRWLIDPKAGLVAKSMLSWWVLVVVAASCDFRIQFWIALEAGLSATATLT